MIERRVLLPPNSDPLILWHWAMCLYSCSTECGSSPFPAASVTGSPRPSDTDGGNDIDIIRSTCGCQTWSQWQILDILSPPAPHVCSPLSADSTFISPLPVAISIYLEVTDINLSAKSATYLSMWVAVLQSGPCAAASQQRSYVEDLAACHFPAGKSTYGHTWPAHPTYPHISSFKCCHRKSRRLEIILSSRDSSQSRAQREFKDSIKGSEALRRSTSCAHWQDLQLSIRSLT